MNIKAVLTPGVDSITVHGLHQWDYGRKLEIHSAELPAIVEIHFACAGMKDAIVRSCEAVSGVATTTIPDVCLEQTSPVYAWVYVIDGTAGYTTKTVMMPVIARTKPQPGATVPAEIYDRYTELVTAVNNAVAKLSQGGGIVQRALRADAADSADTATVATYASADKSKGTIEERLTALGFKEGTVTLSALLDGTVTKNYIRRQGRYVMGMFETTDGTREPMSSELFAQAFPVGTMPRDFAPASATGAITVTAWVTLFFKSLAPEIASDFTKTHVVHCVIGDSGSFGNIELILPPEYVTYSLYYATVKGVYLSFAYEIN